VPPHRSHPSPTALARACVSQLTLDAAWGLALRVQGAPFGKHSKEALAVLAGENATAVSVDYAAPASLATSSVLALSAAALTGAAAGAERSAPIAEVAVADAAAALIVAGAFYAVR
jgi:hypothetical protein